MADLASFQAGGLPLSDFEKTMGSAINVVLHNQEAILLSLREAQEAEDMRLSREEALETVLAGIRFKTGRRERSISVTI